MRKPVFCICENKDADQLRGNREADQRLCFRYLDSTIPLLPKSEMSSLFPYSVIAQPSLCRTRSETPKTGFLTTRLLYSLQGMTRISFQDKSGIFSAALKTYICISFEEINLFSRDYFKPEDQWSCKRSPVWPRKAQNIQNLENIL